MEQEAAEKLKAEEPWRITDNELELYRAKVTIRYSSGDLMLLFYFDMELHKSQTHYVSYVSSEQWDLFKKTTLVVAFPGAHTNQPYFISQILFRNVFIFYKNFHDDLILNVSILPSV